jgi:hypothetical protein
VAGRRRVQSLETLTDGVVDAAERKVRLARSCPVAQLADVPLSAADRADLVLALEKRGLERVMNRVRVPITQQLDAIAGSAPTTLTSVKQRLVGCTQKELAGALKSGAWRLVATDKAPIVARDSDRLLSAREMEELRALSEALASLVKRARSPKSGPPLTLSRVDVASLLTTANARLAPSRSSEPVAVADRVLEGVRRAAHPTTGLASVPEVIRDLQPGLAPERARDELVALARAGKLELRPEAGVELLDAERRALCPPGPRGSVLSYARIVDSRN